MRQFSSKKLPTFPVGILNKLLLQFTISSYADLIMAEKELPSSSFHNEGSASGANLGREETLNGTDEFTEAARKNDLGRCEGITGSENSLQEEEHEGSPRWSIRGISKHTGVAQTD